MEGSGMRQPPPRNLALESLLEERDHLSVQLSLLKDTAKADSDELEGLHQQLADLERLISNHGIVY
jgi:hypothetical protein